MKIFVPGITDATTRKDLLGFSNRVVQKGFRLPLPNHPEISGCPVRTLADPMAVTARHGLPGVSPDDAAVRVIRIANAALLGGSRVGGRHYDAAGAHVIGGGLE